MRGLCLRVFLLVFLFSCTSGGAKKVVEDDFDEFEFEFESNEDEEEEARDDSDSSDTDDEFDTEEFETPSEGEDTLKSGKEASDLKIEESAVTIKPFFEAYLVEICICLGIALYISNYLLGRTKNTNIAEGWMVHNLPILHSQFVLVGDDGEGEEPTQNHVVRRSENSFTVWASGRINCDGLLVHLELMKRHDLIHVILGLFRPVPDTISFIFQCADGDMDSVITAICPRKTATKMSKEYEDLSKYCSGIRSGEKHNLPSSLSVISETFDSAISVLSGGVAKFLSNHADMLLSLHVTDQYTGLKEEGEESETVTIKKGEKRIHLTFKLPSDLDQTTELLDFALKLLDHVKHIRLSREAKDKATKNRQLVVQEQEKLQHQQRQEAAQQRKEEKKKAEKEKMLEETDADKVRKWEEKEYKKQMKKSQTKMKQMKVRMG
ncbi:PREDICTED: coiled-coil domain-containing protein 47-like isoform X2 [Amphimedon queenslandica]|uniref:PAT complex subunit CCDC47 n=1 Tax=Amphimedon queenslandica TaxID=400682 RepID=A0AAN0J3C3_AMPQE|nr:PREDICTED: coiled-coil domain-containing protein 47-like isoform X2 [Amphimedon queenslandica]|eukprot:XP_019851221.1 PREDICTED: coiled-coil domain-containing protein 47-like isoform X2 [Amphimedon queenslandica]